MANKKFVVRLSDEERAQLTGLISKGKTAAKTVLKARILLKADQGEAGEGWADEKICEALDTNVSMVLRARDIRQSRGRCSAHPQAAGNTADSAGLRRRASSPVDRARLLGAAGRLRALDYPLAC
jgi:hypothetical protein